MGGSSEQTIKGALWLIKTGDIGVGPVSTAEIVAMLESGELTGRTQVQRQGDPEGWQRIDATPLLALSRQENVEDCKEQNDETDPDERGWFYGNSFDRNGPVTRTEIKALHAAGKLSAQTLVWREGMDVWQPLHAGHWLLAEPNGTPGKFSYWEARAQTVSTQQHEGWKPGIFSILAMIVVGLLCATYFFGNREIERFKALSPAQQYQERCGHGHLVEATATEFARRRLNLVEKPSFERPTGGVRVKEERNTANDCLFTVEGFLIFKNEFGGQSRRQARISITPSRTQADIWNLVSIDIAER